MLSQYGRTIAVCSLLMLTLCAFASAQEVSVKLVVMLVGDDLAVKPVPKQRFEIVQADVPSDFLRKVSTSFEGTADLKLSPGNYRVRSAAPIAFIGKTFSWDVRFKVSPGQPIVVELSNDNASVEAAPLTSPSASVVAKVYAAVSDGVVTVESESSYGTGFVVDSRGLIMTNAHVVAGSRFFVVQLDDEHRYKANLVYENVQDDIAVLAVHEDVVSALPVLQFARDTPENASVRIGDPVYVIGSPLGQERIITSGIVSKVAMGTLITDALINPGNSGGPVLDAKSQVVGIATFVARTIGGVVRAWKAYPVLEEARNRLNGALIPAASLLPSVPKTKYPTDILETIVMAKDFDLGDYEIKAKKFTVHFNTPPATLYFRHSDVIEAAKGRAKRRKKSKADNEDVFDPIRDIRNWQELPAIVTVVVQPKVKMTIGSAFAVGLVGSAGVAKYKFAGDFDSLRLLRNGEEVPFIRIGRQAEAVFFADAQLGRMSDAAYVGYIEFPYEVFAPMSDKSDKLILEIVNEAKPSDTIRVEVKQSMLERIWEDFAHLRVPVSVGNIE